MKTELPSIGHYELQKCLSRSALSEVWRANDVNTGQTVLIKVFHVNTPGSVDTLEQYIRDVERVASLHSPHIVSVYDVHILPSHASDTSSSLVCLVSQYIEGETLADYIRATSAAGKIPPATEVIELFASLALALDLAHRNGVIHGNLKPTNILLARGASQLSRPLLTDFSPTRFQPDKSSHEIPFYLAPEQVKGAPAVESSDVYALGTILYELYTGVPPFRGGRPIAVMLQHINAQPTAPALLNPAISPALSQVILRCLEKDPSARFSSTSSLVVALAEALHVSIPDKLRLSTLMRDETGSSARSQEAISSSSSTSRPRKRKRGNAILGMITIFSLLLLFIGGYGVFLLAQRPASSSKQLVGHAFFLNSGQINENSNQGISDELQIDLSAIPDAAPGKSYYAWLLGDIKQTEALPLYLGPLSVKQGNIHFLYASNKGHTNLLGFASRFLITEDDTQHPSSNPLLDQQLWRYYAVIPQTPSPSDALHFSMIDHLRHLLVESPELTLRGLHGGLTFWFVKNTATVSNLASTLAHDWQTKDANALHDQLVRILDYLDGSAYVPSAVPSGTPLLADAHEVQVALLGPAPHDTDPPGYVFQNEEPPGYVYLIESHMNGVILSPQVTEDQRQLARQVSSGLDSVKRSFAQIAQDAGQLVSLSNTQLLDPSTLTILDDLATQAQSAYTGHVDPSTGISQGGAIWIYNNLERLATFNIERYTGSGV